MVGVGARKRIYDAILAEHLSADRQMAFVSGPHQVGKTTTCMSLSNAYANWDNLDNRGMILAGPAALVERLGLDRLAEKPHVALFDELHKFPRWKQFLKGFFDTYGDRIRVLVTGSSRMDAFRRGGDSLMGRYFIYRMHPFSLAETIRQDLPDPVRVIRPPARPGKDDFDALWTHGGYPEPFLRRDMRFTRRWQSLRSGQLMREDVRQVTQIQQINQLEILAKLLADRSSRQIVYSSLARDVRVSVDTVRRWIDALAGLHLGFLLKPWFKNVARSLRKEPKWYLRDWASIEDPGSKAETFIACHLLKAVEGWTDLGIGKFELAYLRDKDGREADFIVVRDGRPWFLVEAKLSPGPVAKSLGYFQERIGAPFAFQAAIEADYVAADCFASPGPPIAVPAGTLLSQLL